MAALAVAPAASAAPVLRDVGEFTAPVQVAAPPGDERLFVVEQRGTIQLLRADGSLAPQPFLDVSAETLSGGERGLLGLAFAPDYAESGTFFVYLTAKAPVGELQVRRYQRSLDPERADAGSGVVILRQAHERFSNHNGGGLRIGPDGNLWVTMGDGGDANDTLRSGQDRTTLLGKLLRIRRDGSPAPGNPFIGATDGSRPEIWQYGLRNPFRFSFDRRTKDLLIGDVGQGAREEVDLARATDGLLPGANWGWPCLEGTRVNVDAKPLCTAPGSLPPMLETEHGADGVASITGGVVVRDPGVPSLAGRYLFGDLAWSQLHSSVVGSPDDRAENALAVPVAVSIDEDGCGRVVVTSYQGRVARLVEGDRLSPCSAPSGTPAYDAPAPVVTQSGCGLKAGVPARRSRRAVRRDGILVSLRALAACDVELRLRVRRELGPERSLALLPGAQRSVRLRLGAVAEALRDRVGVRIALTRGGRTKVRNLRVRVRG